MGKAPMVPEGWEQVLGEQVLVGAVVLVAVTARMPPPTAALMLPMVVTTVGVVVLVEHSVRAGTAGSRSPAPTWT